MARRDNAPEIRADSFFRGLIYPRIRYLLAGREEAVMTRALAALLAFPMILAIPVPTLAKGVTVKIEIRGSTLAAPLEITIPDIVEKFNVWTGPGVAVNGKPVHLDPDNQAGMFIDWPRGVATQRPDALPRFVVTFHLRFGSPPDKRRRTYTVLYEFDPITEGGYIYLPEGTDKQYPGNTSLIVHGVEGNWFHASAAWEKLVRPLIEEAQHAEPPEGDRLAMISSL